MKSELLHLLVQLQKEEHPHTIGFQSLILFPNGSALAVFKTGIIPFASLADLEAFAWPSNQSAIENQPQEA